MKTLLLTIFCFLMVIMMAPLMAQAQNYRYNHLHNHGNYVHIHPHNSYHYHNYHYNYNYVRPIYFNRTYIGPLQILQQQRCINNSIYNRHFNYRIGTSNGIVNFYGVR